MSALDTLMLVQAYYDLGLEETAMATLDRFTLEFSFFDELWVTYGNLLVEAKRWDQLRQLASKVRLNSEVGDRLAAFSHYLEGRAELGQGRQELANDAFARISNCRVQNLGLAFSLARNLRRLGQPKIARDVLLPHREAAGNSFEFWDLLARSAFEIKDGELLLTAVTKAFQLAPNNPEVMHNYAAALLVLRAKPDEALRYTRELSQKFPARADVKLNYANALVQNRQFGEAERVLSSLSRLPLEGSEKSAYNYARFELLVNLKRFDEAKTVRGKIRQEDFFPEEIKHLEQLKEQVGKT
jgi:predicted Zn-dependent protease